MRTFVAYGSATLTAAIFSGIGIVEVYRRGVGGNGGGAGAELVLLAGAGVFITLLAVPLICIVLETWRPVDRTSVSHLIWRAVILGVSMPLAWMLLVSVDILVH